MTRGGDLLRGRGAADGRVGFIELFFDLVFVFAVTQLSHYLLAHPTARGAAEAWMLFLAVWWVWVCTIWCTNWLNTDAWPVRLLLFALMGGGLFLAMAIPGAFGKTGLVFALAYAAVQLGRSLFMLLALRGRSAGNFRNFQRISLWFATSGLFWIAGGLAPEGARLPWWLAALGLDCAGPICRFFVPGLGATPTRDWNVEPHHLSERCGLFVIIALGESVLMTGATFAGHGWTLAAGMAFASAFVATAALWWIYFNIGAEEATHHFARSADPGRVARFAYTYLHMPLIAGIIVMAAASELLIAHPLGHMPQGAVAMLVGGPAMVLASILFFKRATAGGWRLSHLVGLAVFALLFVLSMLTHDLPALAIGVAGGLVLLVVALWETVSLGGVRLRVSH